MNPLPPETKVNPPGFATLADAKCALKLMIPPVTEDHRRAFITKLSESLHPKQLAFRLLALLVMKQAGRYEKVLSLLQSELTSVLAGGVEKTPTELPGSSTDDVMLWVRKQFPSMFTLAEASQYLEREQHLWTLYQILRWSEDPAKFMVAITSYTDKLEALTMSESGGAKRRKAKKTNGFSFAIATLIKRVPSRPTALEPLLENLRLCRVFVAASAELQEQLESARSRNDRLKGELDSERTSLVAEKAAHEAVETRRKVADEELKKARVEIERLEETLRIQAGAHQTETVGASAEVLTAVRRKLLPDLENIRLYADRTEPNAAAIVRKAQELTQFLTDFKNK
jgi:hypothetical protein